MPRPNNFIDDFKRDHSKLSKLITALRKTIESSDSNEANKILKEIASIANGHFLFEETYLYPRLRRLVFEITENLRRDQEVMKDFVVKSKDILNKNNRLNKKESASLLAKLPQLSKFFDNCNDLVFLAQRFNKEDKDELNIRFKECHQVKV